MESGSIIKELLSQHPLLIVFDILVLVAAAGSILVLLREAVLFRGYSNLKRVAKQLSNQLQGTIFRDGVDLVISGFFRGLPTVIRFSYSENTPGVHIWVKVASSLSLYVFHESAKLTEGRVRIPTPDERFNERFKVRTDTPKELATLFTDARVVQEIKKVCCSSGTAIALTSEKESLELSEASIPTGDTLRHLSEHLESLAEIAVRAGKLTPLKRTSKTYKPDRYILARAALVLLVVVGSLEIYGAIGHYGNQQSVAGAGMDDSIALSSEDELLLGRSKSWRLAKDEDFNPTIVATLHDHGIDTPGRFPALFQGPGEPQGSAYTLVKKNTPPNSWRIAILSGDKSLLDATFNGVLAVVEIPRAKLSNVVWQSSDIGPVTPDGDGVMVIRGVGDTEVATVFYLSQGKLSTRIPENFWNALLP